MTDRPSDERWSLSEKTPLDLVVESPPSDSLREGVRVTGYSERGAVNALLNDIAYSTEPLELCERFLGLAHFPGGRSIGVGLRRVHVLIEQSFSDFGDADAVFLLEGRDGRAAVFLEAKVKASAATIWTLENELKAFEEGCRTERKLSSSNLFTQLYHKARLVNCLREADGLARLDQGLDFPICSTKGCRRIGSNPVVRKAVKEIAPYVADAWYLSLVPDRPAEVGRFFEEFLPHRWPPPLGTLPDEGKWGGLTWEEVIQFCETAGLKNAARVLDFNDEQICSRPQERQSLPGVGA